MRRSGAGPAPDGNIGRRLPRRSPSPPHRRTRHTDGPHRRTENRAAPTAVTAAPKGLPRQRPSPPHTKDLPRQRPSRPQTKDLLRPRPSPPHRKICHADGAHGRTEKRAAPTAGTAAPKDLPPPPNQRLRRIPYRPPWRCHNRHSARVAAYLPAAVPLLHVQSFADARHAPPPPFHARPLTMRPVEAPVALPSSSAIFPFTTT